MYECVQHTRALPMLCKATPQQTLRIRGSLAPMRLAFYSHLLQASGEAVGDAPHLVAQL